MKRTPLRSKPMRRRPLKKKGETDEAAIMRQARAVAMERDNYTCQARERGWEHECTDWTGNVHAHHVLPRGRGGRDHPANLVCVCDTAHHLIHNVDPQRAYRLGLLQRSGDTPCQVCGHTSRLHASGGQCTYGPELGHECPCTAFVEEAA